MPMPADSRAAIAILKVIGFASILCAVLGISYNSVSFLVITSPAFQLPATQHSVPYLYSVFYAMSAVCLACYAVLLACGIQFLRGRTAHLKYYVTLFLFEGIYFVVIAATGSNSDIGNSIAAATGIANGGLMLQYFILLPLWALPLACWVRKQRHGHSRTAPRPA